MSDFPVVIRVFVLGIWMLAVPFLAGGILTEKTMRLTGLSGMVGRVTFRWCSGQILFWAGFQIICVPMIIKRRNFREVLCLFCIYCGVLALGGIIVRWMERRKYPRAVPERRKQPIEEKVLWSIFGVLVLIQLVCTIVLAYEEGDDAYYVATSTITESSGLMYQTLPYTGSATGLDVRHGLAPMPIWIAFLARVTGLPAVSVAHVGAPVVLIVMTYGLFYIIGSVLLGKGGVKHALFMTVMSLLILFGGYSVYSTENFMLVRTAQGKSVFGNIVVPYIVFLVIILLKSLENDKKRGGQFWLLLAGAVFAGCLCSTQGAMLLCILLGIVGVCAALVFRKWSFLIRLGCCCIPAGCYLALYIILK